ncbi:MAG: hypothetical protein WBA22_19740 [Candidatus Methanofastidiosia archaeon]
MAEFVATEPAFGSQPLPYRKIVSWRVWFDDKTRKFRLCLWVEGVPKCFCFDNLSPEAVHLIIYLLGLDGRRWADPSAKILQVEGGVGKWT